MLEARLKKCYDYDAKGVKRMMDTKTGLKIAYRRKFLGMTQEQIAEKLGVSFQAVSNWERGDSLR